MNMTGGYESFRKIVERVYILKGLISNNILIAIIQ